MHVLERAFRENGREYALRVIRENIISLELKPGITVSANELAAELGVSRGPVREAMTELSKTGIVEVYPQSGCKISLIDEGMILESRFLRNSLECSVLEEVCKNASDEDIEELHQNIILQKFYWDNNMHDKILLADDEFHKKLFNIAKMNSVYDLMKDFVIHLDRLRSLTVATIKNLKVVEDHEQIFQAIQKRDGSLACILMNKHLNRDKTDIDELREAHPDYFVAK